MSTAHPWDEPHAALTDPETEADLLHNREEVFERDDELFERTIAELEDSDEAFAPRNLPVDIWANTYWDRMDPARRDEDILPRLLRPTLRRARTQPVYQESDAFMAMDPDDVTAMEDLLDWPVLTKDGADGFRDAAAAHPEYMMPAEATTDVPGFYNFPSGGTQGDKTYTFLSSQADMWVDAAGDARTKLYGGMTEGDTMVTGYNPTHKGGRVIAKATVDYLGGHLIEMQPADTGRDVVDKIQARDPDVLAAVETGRSDDTKSGEGKNFNALFGIDDQAVTDIPTWFVTGYPIPDGVEATAEALKHDDEHGDRRRLYTTYGTSEAIPLATSTALYDDETGAAYNRQHLTYGPHFTQIGVPDGQDGVRPPEDDEAERGLALVTTVDRRDGTIYINYALGDAATQAPYAETDSWMTTPQVYDIDRIDEPDAMLEAGCTVV